MDEEEIKEHNLDKPNLESRRLGRKAKKKTTRLIHSAVRAAKKLRKVSQLAKMAAKHSQGEMKLPSEPQLIPHASYDGEVDLNDCEEETPKT